MIATVFLTIIAMTGGFVLGERQRDQERASGGGALPSGEPSVSAPPAFRPPGPFCPGFTRRTAEDAGFTSELWLVLKVYAEKTDSTYWICTDRDGELFYQSWTSGGDDPDATAPPADNGLFLKGVVRTGKNTYKVVADDKNEFVVSPDSVAVTLAKNKRTQRYDVRRCERESRAAERGC
ncbi:hypothetical protein [Actinoplanes sp. URMC 104]|uniref:hypothetical protein n=1 Tax=Actinoplanes sp. URMC 104 TaxID=3423409 RepID=UPI003F1A0C84